MNESGGSQSFDIRLTNQQLRRDAQAAMSQFDRIGQRAVQTGRTIDGSVNNMSRSVSGAITKMTQGITSAMSDMAKNMVGITALLSSGAFLKSLFDESTAFTKQMKIVSTISEEVTNDLQGYKVQVLDICREISVAPETAAAALYQINSAGWLGADGMKVLEASAKSAVGGVTETATAADAITTIMNAYHMSASDAEAISDKLFTTVRLGKTTMDELGRSIAYVAPLAATYKISIDEVLAAVAQLTKQGNSTQNAMTQISASITAVANELGDTAFENGLLSALEEIEKRSNGSNLALKAQLSNIRAVRGALGLTKENAAETADMLEQLRNSAGATEDAFRKMNTGAGAEMRMLRTNFLKELEEIGGGMNRTLAGIAHRLNEAFESGSMQTMITVLKDLIITYGIYKTLIITLTALNKVYKNVMSQVAYQKVMAATQQKALNTAEALGAVVTTNLKRAVQALNTALKANAFGLIVAAVAAAAYGIYKYCTRVSEAELAQQRLDKAISNCGAAISAEASKVDVLFTALKQTTKGTAAYERAKQAIIDQYGQYMNGLINEHNEIVNVALAYERVTAAIKESARAKAMDEFTQEANDTYRTKSSEALNNIAKKIRRNVKDRGRANTLIELVNGELEDGGSLSRSTMDILNEAFGNTRAKNGIWMMNGDIKAIKNEAKNYRDAGRILSDSLEDGQAYFGASVNEFAEYTVEQLHDALNNLNEDLTDTAVNTFAIYGKGLMMKTVNTREEALLARRKIEKAIESADTTTAASNKPDWKPAGEEDKGKTPEQLAAEATAARQKRLEVDAQQQRERVRAERDIQFEIEQAAIDAMEDGVEKRLKQRDLDYKKEKDQRQREMEDAILSEIAYQKAVFDAKEEENDKAAAAMGNKHYARKTFNAGSLMSLQDENGNPTYAASKTISEETVGNVKTTAINDILNRYSDVFASIETKNSRTWIKIEESAMNEYVAQWGHGLARRNAIIALANEKMAQAQTEGERLGITAQLEKDLSDFDLEANKKTSAVAQLFADMTDKTIADMRRLETQGHKALDFLTKGEWNAETGAELGMSEETFNTLRKSPEELEKIRRAIAAIKREADGAEGGFKKFAAGLKEIFKAGNDPKKFQEALGKISEGMQTVSQVAGFLQSSLGQLGEAFGNDTLGDIANGIGIAMDAMDSAMQGAQAGAAFGPWGAAAGAAIGLVSSLGSSIAKLHDAKHEKKIQELQDQVEVLERAYDKLDKAISKAYSGKAKELIEQQNVLLRQKQTLIRQQIAEEEAKKKTDQGKIKEWKKQLEEIEDQIADNKEAAIDAIYGEEVSAAIDRFAHAYESMFDGGISRARSSKDLVKQMIKNMIVEAMKADISAPMERLREMMLGFWSDEKITDWEQNQLNGYVEELLAQQENKWGWADGYFKGSSTQSSSKGGFSTISQDSADELNGRFTALQMAGETIKTATLDINEQLRAVAARSAVMASAVDEIRGLSLIAVDHLAAIRKHTANLQEMNERLGKIEKYTSRI